MHSIKPPFHDGNPAEVPRMGGSVSSPLARFISLPASLALAFLILLASPAAAQPSRVQIEDVSPLFDDNFVYMTIDGPNQLDPPQARLAVDLYLRNEGASTIRIDHVTMFFDLPNIGQIQLRDGLEIWCPSNTGGLNPTPSTVATGLDLPPGELCRVGLMPDPLLALPAPGRLRISVFFEGFIFGLNDIERDLVNHVNPTETGAYRFPAKSSDLVSGEYWSARSPGASSNHRFSPIHNQSVHAYDMGIVRFAEEEADPRWREYHPLPPGQTFPLPNVLHLVWGMPVYAMADGEVQGCTSGNPDDEPDLGLNFANPNGFTIAHGDEVAWYGHLRNGSVDPSICFPGALVEEGQFLGEVGNSGSSSAPHLHIQVLRNGDPMPLHFNDTFIVERESVFIDLPDNPPWSPVQGMGLPLEPTMLWPSGVLRRDDAVTGIGTVDNVLTRTSFTRTVTASRTDNGDLTTLLWRTDGSSNLIPLDSDVGGALTDLSLATPTGSTDAALVVRTGAGNLKIIGYDVQGSTLTRTVEHNSNAVLSVEASPGPFTDGVMTALRTKSGNLKVIAWRVDPEAGVIQRRNEAGGGATKDIAMVRTVDFPGVVTAVRTSSDNLKLITFGAAGGGFIVSREDDFEDDEIQDVSIARLGPLPGGGDLVATACRTAAGNLEVISWAIADNGDITRLDEAQAGAIGEVSAARAGNRHLLTSVTTGSGFFRSIAWHVADDGTITRRTDLRAGQGSSIAQGDSSLTGFLLTDPRIAITALSDDNGELKLLSLQTNLTDAP
ncbi:MAG: M23 family metallopeptidase [Deltaproteobacteria bacterium]|nr:M23 family metallopeptidase [Deltaproteobacteria bacterium]